MGRTMLCRLIGTVFVATAILHPSYCSFAGDAHLR